ncbi:MAG: C13 family peptidase, partial [Burkholderiales bacterium]
LWSRAYDGAWDAGADRGLVTESVFYAQSRLLEQALGALSPSRAGIDDVYVLTAALYASEDVFMKEVGVIAELLEQRFDARGRTVRLVNNRATLTQWPIATLTSIRAALAAIGRRMDAQEDLLVLYLTSHGSEKHRLSVDLWPLQLSEIDPADLRKALDDAGIRWRVIVISACYSGGYIAPLKDERTLIITAAATSRQSFGCGSESDFTYLAKALFDEELRRSFSFEDAFANARKTIEAREREQGFVPSEPQIHVGAAIRERLRALEQRLAAAANAEAEATAAGIDGSTPAREPQESSGQPQ